MIAITVGHTTTGRAGAVVVLAEVAGGAWDAVSATVVDETVAVSGAELAAPRLPGRDEPQPPRAPTVSKPATTAAGNGHRADELRRPANQDALPMAIPNREGALIRVLSASPMTHIRGPHYRDPAGRPERRLPAHSPSG